MGKPFTQREIDIAGHAAPQRRDECQTSDCAPMAPALNAERDEDAREHEQRAPDHRSPVSRDRPHRRVSAREAISLVSALRLARCAPLTPRTARQRHEPAGQGRGACVPEHEAQGPLQKIRLLRRRASRLVGRSSNSSSRLVIYDGGGEFYTNDEGVDSGGRVHTNDRGVGRAPWWVAAAAAALRSTTAWAGFTPTMGLDGGGLCTHDGGVDRWADGVGTVVGRSSSNLAIHDGRGGSCNNEGGMMEGRHGRRLGHGGTRSSTATATESSCRAGVWHGVAHGELVTDTSVHVDFETGTHRV